VINGLEHSVKQEVEVGGEANWTEENETKKVLLIIIKK